MQEISISNQVKVITKEFWCVFCQRRFTSRDTLKLHIGDHLGHRPFLCNACGRCFARKHSLKAHLLSHQVPSIECDVCLKTFASETILRRHMMNHGTTLLMRQKKGKISNDESFNAQDTFCEICSKTFENAALFEFHLEKAHRKETRFSCEHCPKAFLSSIYLLKHVEAVHTGVKPFQCELCFRNFRTNFLLKLHIMDHTGELPYACQLCHKKFKRKDLVARHELTHLKESTRPNAMKVEEVTLNDIYRALGELSHQPNLLNFYVRAVNSVISEDHLEVHQCSTCNAAFLIKEALEEHKCGEPCSDPVVENWDKLKKPYECSECKNTYASRHLVYRHMRAKHADTCDTQSNPNDITGLKAKGRMRKLYSCPLCSSQIAFTSRALYDEHFKNNHDSAVKKEGGKLECWHCHKKYKNIKYLRLHMAMHVKSESGVAHPNVCPTCNKVCVTSTQLREHILSHLYSKPKNFYCNDCGRGYTNRRSMVEHVKLHQKGAELRECALCGKSYVSKDQLRSHISRTHFPDSKPYECDTCKKAFKTKVDLNRHRRRHVDHVYNCNVCHQKFKCKLFLERHLIKHEDTKSPNLLENLRRSLRNIEPPVPIKKEADLEIEPEPHLKIKSELESVSQAVHDFDLSQQNEENEQSDEEEMREVREMDKLLNVEKEEPKKEEEALICSMCYKVFYNKPQFKAHCRTHKKYSKNLCSICGTICSSKMALEMHVMNHKGQPTEKCELCDKHYPDKSRLRSHVLSTHLRSNAGFTCHFCNKSLVKKNLLERHIVRHLEKEKFNCKKCDRVFGQEVSLNKHMLIHLGLLPITCDECDLRFLTVQQLNEHKVNHKKMKPFQCEHPNCCKQFRSKVYYKKHLADHSNPEPNICKECGKTFVLKKSLEAHAWIHREDCPYKCTECGKISTSFSALRNHMLIHNPKKNFVCQFCKHGFNAKCHLKRHLARYHQNEERYDEVMKEQEAPPSKPQKTYICSFCGKHFSFRSNLAKHISTHTGLKPIQCPLCPKSFNHKGDLRTHMPQHTGERFACNECPKNFLRQKYLEIHHQAAHSNQARWVCTICSLSFISKVVLTRHITTHTGIKPFECHIQDCGRGFHTQRSLDQHLLTHENAARFICPECDRGFAVKRYLTLHMRLHSENPKFRCETCDKPFLTRQHFERHQKKHAPKDKNIQCNICFKKFLNARGLENHMLVGKHLETPRIKY